MPALVPRVPRAVVPVVGASSSAQFCALADAGGLNRLVSVRNQCLTLGGDRLYALGVQPPAGQGSGGS